VLRRIFWPKRDEVAGEWRKLHNEELNDLCYSPDIMRVIKSRRMRWTGHVARVGRGDVYTGLWWGNLRERDHLEDLGVEGSIILRWTLLHGVSKYIFLPFNDKRMIFHHS